MKLLYKSLLILMMMFLLACNSEEGEEPGDDPETPEGGAQEAAPQGAGGVDAPSEEIGVPAVETIPGLQSSQPAQPPAPGAPPDETAAPASPAANPASDKGFEPIKFLINALGYEFVVLYKQLSNGQKALWVVDNETGMFSWFTREDYSAFLRTLLRQMHNYKVRPETFIDTVCSGGSVEERRERFIRYGLPVGTLVLVNSDSSISTYMGAVIRDESRLKGYAVRQVSLTNDNIASVALVNSRETQEPPRLGVPRIGSPDWDELNAVHADSLDLEEYLAFLESVKGPNGDFASCDGGGAPSAAADESAEEE